MVLLHYLKPLLERHNKKVTKKPGSKKKLAKKKVAMTS